MNLNPIKILLVEDNPGDARLVKEMLAGEPRFKHELTHVSTLLNARESVAVSVPDVVLLDLSLPDGHTLKSGIQLVDSFKEVPVVILTGLDDNNVGLESIQRGAQDYLVKGQIDGKLMVRVILYSIERKQSEREKEKLIMELKDLFAQVKTLRGLLPMCTRCKKIRDENGEWTVLEDFIQEHSNTDISHGLCPDCSAQH
ncbi:MAG: response regulator [Bacteroidota bacterium]